MTAGWFVHPRRVDWTDVDPSSNYQFSAALRYVEEAEIAWLREEGVLDDLYPHFPRTFVEASFRSPAHFGDLVDVLVRVRRVGRSSVEFAFRILKDDLLCAEGVLGAAYLGDDGRSAPLPEHVRRLFEGSLTATEAAHAAP